MLAWKKTALTPSSLASASALAVTPGPVMMRTAVSAGFSSAVRVGRGWRGRTSPDLDEWRGETLTGVTEEVVADVPREDHGVLGVMGNGWGSWIRRVGLGGKGRGVGGRGVGRGEGHLGGRAGKDGKGGKKGDKLLWPNSCAGARCHNERSGELKRVLEGLVGLPSINFFLF